MHRRSLLLTGLYGSSAIVLGGCGAIKKYSGLGGSDAEGSQGDRWQQRLAALEAKTGGRLGVSVRLSGDERSLDFRSDERFAMCSTFKLLLVAQILRKAQLGEFSLEQSLLYEKSDLIVYSPVTEKYAGFEGMTVRALCEAAVVMSDNTAANLLLGLQDGPAGLTQWLRTQGDMKTRLDRKEPDLNTAIAGDDRDSTTPDRMSRTALALLTSRDGSGQLSAKNQRQLIDWLLASRTGDKRLRVGMPQQWVVGGKTGSGDNGTANDVCIVWPGERSATPMMVSTFLTGASAVEPSVRDAVIADVGRVVADWYAAGQTSRKTTGPGD